MTLYRVRVEAYDTETEQSKVLLDENEDGGYVGMNLFGITEEGHLRAIVQHMTTSEIAAAFMSDDCYQEAARMVAMHGIMSKLHGNKGDEGCPQ